MPRKKGSRDTSSQHQRSKAFPTTRQTSNGLLEESTWSDYPDSFFTEGIVKTLPGTSNVLLVAPNMSPDTDDKNITLLACWLAEALRGYAVINCQCYRKPVEGDPIPEELQLSDSPTPSKEDKRILKLRQRLLEETGGIPVDLDSFNYSQIGAYDYLINIWWEAGGIGYKAIPLVFFLCGIDDVTADKYGLDVALGAGYSLQEGKQTYVKGTATAERKFVKELLGRLRGLRDRVRVREGVEGYDLARGDEVGGWLRYNWNDRFDPSMADGWRANDIYSVLLAVRYTGFRDSKENLRRTAKELAHTICGLSLFKSWQETEMAKEATKKPKKSKEPKEKGKPLKSGSIPTQKQPIVSPQSAEVDQTLVNNAVHFINEKANEHVYKAYEEIGIYLLEKFFNNDVSLASSKNPRKPASYSELCRREDLAIHPARLGVMVRVAAQENFFRSEKLPSEKLSYTHKAELVKLPDDQRKIDLAKECIKKSLSTRQLAERVSEILKEMPRSAPVPLKLLESKLSDTKKLFADARITEMLLDEDTLEKELRSLSPKKREKFYEDVSVILEKSTKWVRGFEILYSQLEVYFMEGE